MERVASQWREKYGKYNLVGSKCSGCGMLHFPASTWCECGSKEMEDFMFSGKGTIHTYSIVRVAPAGFGKEAPYAVAVVELDEGPRLATQIVGCDPETINIGDKVAMAFRKIAEDGKSGIISYGFKFRLDTC